MKARVAALLALLAVALGGCSNQTVRDLEGIPVQDPDRVELIVNVDRYPNLVALCVHGAGFVATTRDQSPAALQRVEAWDATNESGWCGQE